MQAKPRLDEVCPPFYILYGYRPKSYWTLPTTQTVMYALMLIMLIRKQVDLSMFDPRLVQNYFENILPPNMRLPQSRSLGTHSRLCMTNSDSGLFRVQPVSQVTPYRTTITPFGPVLPTNFSLSSKEVPQSGPRAISSAVVQAPRISGNMGVNSAGSVPLPVAVSTASASVPAEIVKWILHNDSSSSESDCDEPLTRESQTNTRRTSRANAEFVQQATAVHSPVMASSIPVIPNEAPALSPPSRIAGFRSPRPERLRKKREELEKVQQFIEEQRVVHEKIYASFDVRRVSTRGVPDSGHEKMNTTHKPPNESVNDSNNVAELRRNIAVSSMNSHRREISPLPPTTLNPQRAASADKRTPSASSRSPRPVSPDRIVSGVFVSYPRKARRSVSAPPPDSGAGDVAVPVSQDQNLLSSLRPQGTGKTAKMTETEYAELRRNLLTRSEQHAVTSTGSSLT